MPVCKSWIIFYSDSGYFRFELWETLQRRRFGGHQRQNRRDRTSARNRPCRRHHLRVDGVRLLKRLRYGNGSRLAEWTLYWLQSGPCTDYRVDLVLTTEWILYWLQSLLWYFYSLSVLSEVIFFQMWSAVPFHSFGYWLVSDAVISWVLLIVRDKCSVSFSDIVWCMTLL